MTPVVYPNTGQAIHMAAAAVYGTKQFSSNKRAEGLACKEFLNLLLLLLTSLPFYTFTENL
jgi:hypothetical protein